METIGDIDCLFFMLGFKDELSILIIYHPLSSSLATMSDLTTIPSGLMLEMPRLIVQCDFNILDTLVGSTQGFITSLATMGLSQVVTGPTQDKGHT